MYTEDQLYDMLDTSVEQQLSFRAKRDFLNIYNLTPEEAYDLMTDDYLDKKIDDYVNLVVKADKEGSKLGIRKEVLRLGFEERYYGLRYNIEKMGEGTGGLMYEVIKKMLGLIPRKVMLISKQIETEEEYKEFYKEIYKLLIQSDSDESYKEILYLINNQIERDSLYGEFIKVMGDVIKKLHYYQDYIFDELYYTPHTLRVAIRLDIEEDLNGRRMKSFPIKEYLEEDSIYGETYKEDDLYIGYLEEIIPVKQTKVLGRLWEDIEEWLESEDSFSEEEREFYKEQFNYGKYIFNGEKLLSFRDGLLVLDKLGTFEKTSSSKVRKGYLEDIQEEFIGGEENG